MTVNKVTVTAHGRDAQHIALRLGLGVDAAADPIDEAATNVDPVSSRVMEALQADEGLITLSTEVLVSDLEALGTYDTPGWKATAKIGHGVTDVSYVSRYSKSPRLAVRALPASAVATAKSVTVSPGFGEDEE